MGKGQGGKCPACGGSITVTPSKLGKRYKCNDEFAEGCKSNGYIGKEKAGASEGEPKPKPAATPKPKPAAAAAGAGDAGGASTSSGNGGGAGAGGNEPPKRGGFFGFRK